MKVSEGNALARVAAYCSKGERCKSDVLKKLKTWELEEDAIARIMERLVKENFLNEERFCASFVKDKMRFNKWGKNKIVFELKRKYIPDSLIQSAFEDLVVDEFEETLMQILKTKQRSVKGKDDYDRRNKLIRFALGRGYTMDQVLKAVENLMGAADDFDI